MNLLQILSDTSKISNVTFDGNNLVSAFWKYTAIGELLIIIFLVILYFKTREKKLTSIETELKKAKNNNVNMDDLMLNINNSRNLYKLLSKNCHPDRFINSISHSEVELLFQKITENKRNFQELVKLKEIAINQFNIKIE
jgi:uncharacterized membrane-anchored protein YhcB (DUF1043 family)